MVPFGGWDMPVQYTGILDETRAVRNSVGVFDVSHMGRVVIKGAGAGEFLSRIFSTDVGKLVVGRAKYGVTCDQEGGIIDDNIVYRLSPMEYMFIPNAGNREVIALWLNRWLPGDGSVVIDDLSERTAMIAVQGPDSLRTLSVLAGSDLESVSPFRIVEMAICGQLMLVARTGYTGEDGFEIMPSSDVVLDVWDQLIEQGAHPCGLGARDVLRLEAGLLLHGNDIDQTVNPYEAGLDKFVDADREGYLSGTALCEISHITPTRSLVGFIMVGRGIARHGYPITDGSEMIGTVTSGSVSPTLDKAIGLGYVPTGFISEGTRLFIEIRGKKIEAEVTSLPFYLRSR